MRRFITLAAVVCIFGLASATSGQSASSGEQTATWPGRKNAPVTTPALFFAIQRKDADCVPDAPFLDQGARYVRMPDAVREAIHGFAVPRIRRIEAVNRAEANIGSAKNPNYPTKKELDGSTVKTLRCVDHYGPIFRIPVPGSDRLCVWVLRMRVEMSFIVLRIFVHDAKTGHITAQPFCISMRWAHRRKDWYLTRPPLVHFDDLDQDGRPEVVVQQREHNGPMINLATYDYLRIGKDAALTPIFELTTRIADFYAKGGGYINRSIQKLAPGKIRLTSILVKKPLDREGEMAGSVVLEQPKPGAPFQVVSRDVRLPRYKGLLVGICGE